MGVYATALPRIKLCHVVDSGMVNVKHQLCLISSLDLSIILLISVHATQQMDGVEYNAQQMLVELQDVTDRVHVYVGLVR